MKGIANRTTKLGFNVLRLHYSCDPDKDPSTPNGKKWYDEARKGMSEARWRQEYEIDFGAMGGQLVLPEFEESLHVVPNRMPLDPYYHTVWLACDPHPRTPHAFLWLAINKEGEMAVVWSWWRENPEQRLTVNDYAARLKTVDESSLNLKPYRRLMDVAGKSFNADEERSYFDAYRGAKDENGKSIGIIFQPAKKNRDLSGYDLISQALKPTKFTDGAVETLRPRLTVWKGCGDNDELVYQMKTLRFREWKGQITDKDAPEEPQEKRRHLIDCLSYILLDNPRFIEKKPRQKDADDPNIVIAVSTR